MAIQMTRAEYEAKYGTKAPVVTSPVPSAPVQMTRAEYEAKYGQKPAALPSKTTIAQDFKARTDKGALAFEAGARREITPMETGLRVLGQGGGFIGDLTGKALSAVTPDVIGDALLKPVQAIAGSKFGKSIASGYNMLPERARTNIEAAGNIASILPIGKGASVAAKGTTKTAMLPIKGATGLAVEALGKTTGAGAGAIKEGFRAAKEGAESATAFKQGLRGDYSPEQLVDEARGGLKTVKDNRTATYVKQLEEIKAKDANAKALDVSPIVSEVDKQLTRFGVTKTPQGLDFSRSSLRFDKPAQQEIQTIVDEMAGFGLREGDRSVTGVDSLKRAVGSLYSASSDARAFTQAIKSKTREVLGKVEGYNKLSDDYVKNTEFIDDLTKNLSLGDKAAVETTYKKLTSALKQNNEFRKQLVDELDAVVGSKLSSKIAGQQLSPKLASGIAGSLTPALGTGLAFSGGGIPALLVGLAASSPRLIGEIVNTLGYVGNKAKKVKDFLTNQREIPRSARNAESSLSPAMMSKNINNSIIPNTLPQTLETSRKLSTVKSLPIRNRLQEGYIADPLAKRELPVSKSSSVNNTLSNDLIEASVSSKLPPRTIPKSKPNFTPELKKNIAEIIDSQRGTTKLSQSKMLELESDMTSIIEDFGFAIPTTKAGRLKLLDMIYNQAI